jgi:WD40 repeat protein
MSNDRQVVITMIKAMSNTSVADQLEYFASRVQRECGFTNEEMALFSFNEWARVLASTTTRIHRYRDEFFSTDVDETGLDPPKLTRQTACIEPTPSDNTPNELINRQWVVTLPHDDCVYSCCFSRDSKSIASATRRGELFIWNVDNATHRWVDVRPLRGYSAVCYSPDGKFLAAGSLATGSDDQSICIRVFDATTGGLVDWFNSHEKNITNISFSPNSKHIVTTSRHDRTVRIWDLEQCPNRHDRWFDGTVACFLTDTVLVVGFGDELTVWDIEKMEQSRFQRGTCDTISAVCASPDGKLVAFSSSETVFLWDLSVGPKNLCRFNGHEDDVTSLCFSSCGKYLATGSCDKTVRIWNVETQQQLYCFTDHDDTVMSLSFSPDGQCVASSSIDCTVCVWYMPQSMVKGEFVTMHGELTHGEPVAPAQPRAPPSHNDLLARFGKPVSPRVHALSSPDSDDESVVGDDDSIVIPSPSDMIQITDTKGRLHFVELKSDEPNYADLESNNPIEIPVVEIPLTTVPREVRDQMDIVIDYAMEHYPACKINTKHDLAWKGSSYNPDRFWYVKMFEHNPTTNPLEFALFCNRVCGANMDAPHMEHLTELSAEMESAVQSKSAEEYIDYIDSVTHPVENRTEVTSAESLESPSTTCKAIKMLRTVLKQNGIKRRGLVFFVKGNFVYVSESPTLDKRKMRELGGKYSRHSLAYKFHFE